MKAPIDIFRELANKLRFRAFSDGYSYGYDLYLAMRRKHPGKNERATLTDIHPTNHNVLWFTDAWANGLSVGWTDATGDWLTTFSVEAMEQNRNEYSVKEELEMIKKKFEEYNS